MILPKEKVEQDNDDYTYDGTEEEEARNGFGARWSSRTYRRVFVNLMNIWLCASLEICYFKRRKKAKSKPLSLSVSEWFATATSESTTKCVFVPVARTMANAHETETVWRRHMYTICPNGRTHGIVAKQQPIFACFAIRFESVFKHFSLDLNVCATVYNIQCVHSVCTV